MEYASKAQGNAGVALGIIGTSLGAIANAGGLMGLFGGNRNQANMSEGDRPVTRYEMGLIQENNRKDGEIVLLKSQGYTDRAIGGVEAQIGQQIAWNAVQGENIQTLQNQLAGITKLVVPNGNVMPGWGPVTVTPLPPPVISTTTPTPTSTTSQNS